MQAKRFLLLTLAATSVLMSACVVTPVAPYYDQPVRLPPPPMRQEYPGYAPAPDYVWVSGYWGWGGARYEWMPGRWEAPRHGHIWVPHRWERNGDHWRQSGGRWEQDSRARPAPAPRIEVQSMPRPEPRREWREEHRYEQPRYDQRQAAPRVERDSVRPLELAPSPRHERGNAPRQEFRPAPAPAAAPAAAPAQVQRDDRSRGDGKGDGRSKRHDRDNERQGGR